VDRHRQSTSCRRPRLPVEHGQVAQVRAAEVHAEVHQPVERRGLPEPLLANPVDIGEVQGLVLRQQVAMSVRVAGSHQGVAVGRQLRVGVGRRPGVVGPVVDGGDAGRDAFDEAKGDAAVEVLGFVHGGGGPLGGKVLEALGDVVASQRAPHVEVAVDEARHDDHARGVEALRFRGVEPRGDRDDPAVAHVDVGAAKRSDGGVQRDDGPPWMR